MPLRSRCRFRHCAAATLLLSALLPVLAAAEALQPDRPLELALQPGQALSVTLELAPGSALRLRVIEQGVDVEPQLVAADQRWPAEDDDILRWGEHRFALVQSPASLTLELRATRQGSPPGRVRLELEKPDLGDSGRSATFGLDLSTAEVARRMADPQSQREPQTVALLQTLCQARREAGQTVAYLRCVGVQERLLGRQSRRPEAIASLEQALPYWRTLDDPRGLASALNNLGMHHHWLGDGRLAAKPLQQALAALDGVDDDLLRAVIQNNICLSGALRDSLREARACNERALALSQASGDTQRIATAYNNLGGTYFLLGDSAAAGGYFERSLALRAQLDDVPGSGDPRYNLALVRIAQGRLAQALEALEQTTTAYRRGNNSSGQANALRARGYVQLLLGEPALAQDLMQQALELQRKSGRRNAVVATLSRLAEAQLQLGDVAAARASADEAVAAAAVDANPPLLADARIRAARIYRQSGDPASAVQLAQQALAAAEPLQQSPLADQARIELAQLALLQGQATQARVLAAQALKSRQLAALPQLDARNVLAAALRAEGRRAAAEAAYRDAVATTEQAAALLFDLELRANFLAGRDQAQQGLIALLMDARDGSGAMTRAAEALVLSEDFRARSLRDRLDAGADAALAAEPEREALLAQLAALSLARWKQLEQRGDTRQTVQQIDAQMRAAEAQLRQLDDRSRARFARRVARPQWRIADLQQALPADASLLVYRLQAQESFAWVLQRDGLQVRRLAGAGELAARVQQVRDGLAAGAEPPRAALEQACDALWQPLAQWLQSPRVYIVADGALDGLPFAALRCGESRDYLLQRFELARLPAAWLLLRPATTPLREDYTALLVGDPVYSRDDVRLGTSPLLAAATPPARLRNGIGRLQGSAQELQRVRERLGAQRSTVLRGLDASLAAVDAATMSTFDIIHFATHGVDGGASAAGSGLVLSLFDMAGATVDGFLSTRRIANRQLRASLVVLGACDSASGRAIAGEGTLSVAHAFLQAGARHVVAALWPLQDGVMPELMDGFYAEPRLAALQPAQALRQAQLKLLQRYPDASPALWAGLAVWGR